MPVAMLVATYNGFLVVNIPNWCYNRSIATWGRGVVLPFPSVQYLLMTWQNCNVVVGACRALGSIQIFSTRASCGLVIPFQPDKYCIDFIH